MKYKIEIYKDMKEAHDNMFTESEIEAEDWTEAREKAKGLSRTNYRINVYKVNGESWSVYKEGEYMTGLLDK